MRSVASIRFHDAPDYDHFRSILSTPELSSSNRATSNDDDEEVILSLKMEPSRVVTSVVKNLPGPKPIARPKKFRGRRKQKSATAKLGQKKPKPLTSVCSPSRPDSGSEYRALRNRRDREVCVESMKNPTPMMLQQLERMKARPASEAPSVCDERKDR